MKQLKCLTLLNFSNNDIETVPDLVHTLRKVIVVMCDSSEGVIVVMV